MDIIEMLGKFSKKDIDEAVKKAQEFTKTKEGQEMVEKIKNGEAIDGIPISGEEQNKLISSLSKNPEVMKKIGEILGGKR
ncbi:MAG: hypothetical protein IKA17_06995 [Clostridia bacterium]|nr:hypothetical protein [Clostridia bacterium]